MAVVLLPLVEGGGDEQVVWLEIWFRIALELGPAGMDIFLAETSCVPVPRACWRITIIDLSAIETLVFSHAEFRGACCNGKPGNSEHQQHFSPKKPLAR